MNFDLFAPSSMRPWGCIEGGFWWGLREQLWWALLNRANGKSFHIFMKNSPFEKHFYFSNKTQLILGSSWRSLPARKFGIFRQEKPSRWAGFPSISCVFLVECTACGSHEWPLHTSKKKTGMHLTFAESSCWCTSFEGGWRGWCATQRR